MKQFFTLIFLLTGVLEFSNSFAQGNFRLNEGGSIIPVQIISLDTKEIILPSIQNLKGTLINSSEIMIHNLVLNYEINGGETISESIKDVNIEPGMEYSFSHPVSWHAIDIGKNEIEFWVSGEENNGELRIVSEKVKKTVVVATNSVQRLPLVEEFTSSTCGPCASFNSSFDPFIVSRNANKPSGDFAMVKYQMNWPGAGNDPSFNSESSGRKNFYGVNSIPYLFVDGVNVPASTSYVSNAVDNSRDNPAFVDIKLTYSYVGTSLTVKVVTTPLVGFGLSSMKLFIAVTDDSYTYSNKTYRNVFRKMLPNGGGNTLTSMTTDVDITTTRSYTFTVGDVTQNSFKLWGGMDKITVVAFGQSSTSKEVYQAAIASEPTVIIEEARNFGYSVFPNPTEGITNLIVEARDNGKVSLEVFNSIGALVQSQDFGNQNSGRQVYAFDGSNLSEGIYYISLNINGEKISQKISIIK